MNNDLISRSALKEAIRKRLGISSLKYLTEQEKVIVEEIDNAPSVEPSLNLDGITDEEIEKFKIIWQRANSKGLLVINEDKPQCDCNNCDFRKFTEKFIDGVVELMNENDIASLEQLSEMLGKGNGND